MTTRQVMQQALDALDAMKNAMLDQGVNTDPAHPNRQALNYGVTAMRKLRAELAKPQAQPEPEMHDAQCPALTGGKCSCTRSPVVVDKAWARFCGGVGRGPDAPYPGMIEAFEAHYSQSFTDKEWRAESGVWAAAWKAAKGTQPDARLRVREATSEIAQPANKFCIDCKHVKKAATEIPCAGCWRGFTYANFEPKEQPAKSCATCGLLGPISLACMSIEKCNNFDQWEPK